MVAGERQLNFQLFTIFRSQRITEQDFNIINLLNSFYGPEVLNLLCAKKHSYYPPVIRCFSMYQKLCKTVYTFNSSNKLCSVPIVR